MARGVPKDGRTKSLKNLPAQPTKTRYSVSRKGMGGAPEKYTEEWLKEEAKALIEWLEKDEGIYIGDFTFERGYSRQRLVEFANKSIEFSDALEFAKHWQERKMLRGGLLRDMDATQVRYTMARLCGDIWKASYDREETDRDITLNINVNKMIE